MALKVTQQGDTVENYQLAFVADSVDDVKDLPTDAPMGSTCFIIDNSTVYMAKSDGTWKEI